MVFYHTRLHFLNLKFFPVFLAFQEDLFNKTGYFLTNVTFPNKPNFKKLLCTCNAKKLILFCFQVHPPRQHIQTQPAQLSRLNQRPLYRET